MPIKTLDEESMKMLGVPKVGGKPWTFVTVRDQIKKGFPGRAVSNLRKMLHIDVSGVANLLGVSTKTISRIEPKDDLRAAQSDRAYRVVRTLVLATRILGTREKAIGWLHDENDALAGATPLEFLDNDAGTREVEDILNRIKYGMYS